MKKIFLCIILFLIISCFSGCSLIDNKKSNVHNIINCFDDSGYAISAIDLIDNNGFVNGHHYVFSVDILCQHVRTANKIEIIGQNFMQDECIIID